MTTLRHLAARRTLARTSMPAVCAWACAVARSLALAAPCRPT